MTDEDTLRLKNELIEALKEDRDTLKAERNKLLRYVHDLYSRILRDISTRDFNKLDKVKEADTANILLAQFGGYKKVEELLDKEENNENS